MTEQAIRDEDIIRTEEGLIFNPYNHLNTEIKLNDVQSILKTYGIPPNVHNMELYRRAFIHRSYTKRPDFENLQLHDGLPKETSNRIVSNWRVENK